MSTSRNRVTDERRLGLSEDARVAALVGFTLAAVAVVVANTHVRQGENGGTGLMLAGIAISAVAALGVGILVFSLTRHPARTGMVLSCLGLLTVVAFWSGLPFVLGSMGLALARRASGRLATSAQVVGALAVLAASGVAVLDRL